MMPNIRKIINKVPLIIALVLLSIFSYFVVIISIHYIPQMIERYQLNIKNNGGESIVSNTVYKFAFNTNNKCVINTDTINNIVREHWRGQLVCGDQKYYLTLAIQELPRNATADFNTWGYDINSYSYTSRIYKVNSSNGSFFMLIKHPSENKVFNIIGSPKSKFIWQDILDTVKEIN